TARATVTNHGSSPPATAARVAGREAPNMATAMRPRRRPVRRLDLSMAAELLGTGKSADVSHARRDSPKVARMTIWDWISEAAESGVGAIGSLLAWTAGLFAGIGDPATRRQVAFSMALIALSAKMAKADGVVTATEVQAFRRD